MIELTTMKVKHISTTVSKPKLEKSHYELMNNHKTKKSTFRKFQAIVLVVV